MFVLNRLPGHEILISVIIKSLGALRVRVQVTAALARNFHRFPSITLLLPALSPLRVPESPKMPFFLLAKPARGFVLALPPTLSKLPPLLLDGATALRLAVLETAF